MAFQVNTNIASVNAHAQGTFTQRKLQSSLEKLSSGLRINKAADDASGMAIADSLRSQSNALTQAIRNTNDSIGIIQIADKAMDEQIKILDLIKTKAVQAAQDGQSTNSRKAIQADIIRLIESLDNIAATTTYNNQALLSGSFNAKEFQIGAYSNQSVKASIGATSSDKIGQISTRTNIINKFSNVTFDTVSLDFKKYDGQNDLVLESVQMGYSTANVGLGRLTEVINKNSNTTGIRASYQVQVTAPTPVAANTQTHSNFAINGVTIGNITNIKANDNDGKLIAAINAVTDQTGVQAFIDAQGRLNLTSLDGRGIKLDHAHVGGRTTGGVFSPTGSIVGINKLTTTSVVPLLSSINYIGRLTLVRTDGRAIDVAGADKIGFLKASVAANGAGTALSGTKISNFITTVNLRDTKTGFNKATQASAIALFANSNIANDYTAKMLLPGVTSLRGAMLVMDVAESAIKMLDRVRADLGSVQQQMQSTMDNITVTQVNVKASESNIREVDFAAESSEYSKLSILAQAGSYALSQANTSQQNILRLLQ